MRETGKRRREADQVLWVGEKRDGKKRKIFMA
jgi:hypothetical protein